MPTKKAAKKVEKPAKKASPKKAAPAPKPRPAPPKPTYSPPPPPKPKAAPVPPPAPVIRAPPAPAPRPAPSPAPRPSAAPAPSPEFVKKASFADRKAALEALAEKEGLSALPTAAPLPPPAPKPSPTFVREATPADRKAALEQVVAEQGVTGLLAKAPWKRGAPPPPPAPAPPTPALPAERTGPRVQMTKNPIETTTGRSAPKKVILDSNALMMQFQFHIDIEKEVNRLLNGNYEYVVPQIVVDELSRISKEGGGKEAGEARMAIELAKTFEVMESPGDGDTGILRLAEKINAIVVTNDKKLRAQLRAKDIPNIYMRSRAFLTVDGHIPGM